MPAKLLSSQYLEIYSILSLHKNIIGTLRRILQTILVSQHFSRREEKFGKEISCYDAGGQSRHERFEDPGVKYHQCIYAITSK